MYRKLSAVEEFLPLDMCSVAGKGTTMSKIPHIVKQLGMFMVICRSTSFPESEVTLKTGRAGEKPDGGNLG